MATPDHIRRRGRWSLVLGTLVAALSFAAVAYADQIDEDADLVAAGNQASRDLGTVAPGAILTPPVSFELQCNGNRHVNSGQSVNLTFSLSGSTVPGGNLSATNTTIGPIPASWPDDGTNCPSPAPAPIPDNGNSVVTITAPATPGSYTFIVKWDKSVSPPDVTGSGPSVAFDLTVEAPNEPPTVDAGGPYNGSEGSAVSLDGTATDPDGDPVTTSWSYAAVTADSGATCDFGDAGAADTTVTCTDDGTFTLTLTADDGVNDPVSDSTTLTLSNADPSATPSIPAGDVNEGDSFSLSLSSPSDPGANDTFTYQFDCGDGGGYNAASSTASRTCPTTDNGSRAVKLKILDDDGGFAEYTGDVTVVNVPPVVTSFTCPTGPVPVNTSVTLTGAFTDVGTADTHTASIAWGDGNSAAATVTQGAGSGSVSGSHAYGAAGIYTPSLTVTDDDGGSDAESCEYVVVYDPSAGFVTGGGWINSPAGAYLADPTMTGKATFGFVSKYKKGANVPDGSTEFQFHAAGLNFKSTAYQWLVVAGSKATYKGWGTINGLGNYGFLLSALDGSPDKFRIKIWDVGSGDVVYDNNLGGGDDADPATGLGGGSIVHHTGPKNATG